MSAKQTRKKPTLTPRCYERCEKEYSPAVNLQNSCPACWRIIKHEYNEKTLIKKAEQLAAKYKAPGPKAPASDPYFILLQAIGEYIATTTTGHVTFNLEANTMLIENDATK